MEGCLGYPTSEVRRLTIRQARIRAMGQKGIMSHLLSKKRVDIQGFIDNNRKNWHTKKQMREKMENRGGH